MRGVENPKDDFFAPRPKLSWNVRVIRSAAFLMAIGISIGFLGLYMIGIGDLYKGPESLPHIAVNLLWPIIWHIIALVPCWRAWLLRRWACFLLSFLLLATCVFLLLSVIWLGVIALFFMATFLDALGEKWPNLKSGF